MAEATGPRIGPDGYFQRDGRRWVPAGVNYWPASAGVEMWQRWPADEIRHDLDVVRELGLNSIRFFLRWQDFEPAPGEYDARMFERLADFLTWCAEREVMAQPSLFVGFMSGGFFWPAWQAGRNIFADPFMVERAAAFAGRAAAVIAPFHAGLLGIDQGNELSCLPDSVTAPPSAVVAWCGTINAAIRRVYPECLIVSGNEQNQILNDTGWRFGEQPGTDYYSMHGYPVPAWHRIAFDGMTDPLCQTLLPFYTRIARAFGAVMVQEFGTIVTFGAAQQDRYLRAILPACWEAGSNGFLWWCLRDITADVHPYIKNSFEGTLGLVDARDRVKPGLEYYLEFARSLPERPAPRQADEAIGLYFPRHYYLRENQANPGNSPLDLSRRLIIAAYLLGRLGHAVRIVRGDRPLDPALRTLVVPGALLAGDEIAALDGWVRAGGRLIWHGPDPMNWSHTCGGLLGAWPVDYRSPIPVRLEIFDDTWTFATYPRAMRMELVPDTATVLANDERGLPVVLSNTVGQGRVRYALPLVEDAMAAVSADREARDRWTAWYAGMLQN